MHFCDCNFHGVDNVIVCHSSRFRSRISTRSSRAHLRSSTCSAYVQRCYILFTILTNMDVKRVLQSAPLSLPLDSDMSDVTSTLM